uniref:Uncharacterized protein n=1 Tax=viral metagenome TaxID=1070528 RepID=A0A6M3LCU0_9ZZZZ
MKEVICVSERNIIKASLIAGLNLWGFPNIKQYADNVSGWIEELNIEDTFYRTCDSGLIWGRDKNDIIHRETMAERVREQSDAVGFEDPEECFGNSMIDDSEYVFNLKEKGFTGYSTKSQLFDKRLRSKDGKLYTCWAGEIFIYEMDIDSVKECKKFIQQLIRENKK